MTHCRRLAVTLRYNLLDEPLIRTRLLAGGQPKSFSLPALFLALGQDAVRDFPAVRPHQRHPWHAFLVQLAAIALHRAGRSDLFDSEEAWKQALLALTPEHPDGAARCLIAPHDRPAFMQAPVPGGRIDGWKNTLRAADELDMLVTSKNHDLKAARMRRAEVDDWVMALISLQTQEGFLGAGNYGISRMNGGFASRPAIGVVPKGHWGQRWARDVRTVLTHREAIVEEQGLKDTGGTDSYGWRPGVAQRACPLAAWTLSTLKSADVPGCCLMTSRPCTQERQVATSHELIRKLETALPVMHGFR